MSGSEIDLEFCNVDRSHYKCTSRAQRTLCTLEDLFPFTFCASKVLSVVGRSILLCKFLACSLSEDHITIYVYNLREAKV
jgi:hypothetical protein